MLPGCFWLENSCSVQGKKKKSQNCVIRDSTKIISLVYGCSFRCFLFFLFFFPINLFIYLFNFWLRWVFVAARGLSLVVVSGGYSPLRCVGFSLLWLLLLWSTGSRHTGFRSRGSQALECRLSSCGARA